MRASRTRGDFCAKLDIPALAIRMGSVGGFLPDYGTPLNVPGFIPIEAKRTRPLANLVNKQHKLVEVKRFASIVLKLVHLSK